MILTSEDLNRIRECRTNRGFDDVTDEELMVMIRNKTVKEPTNERERIGLLPAGFFIQEEKENSKPTRCNNGNCV